MEKQFYVVEMVRYAKRNGKVDYDNIVDSWIEGLYEMDDYENAIKYYNSLDCEDDYGFTFGIAFADCDEDYICNRSNMDIFDTDIYLEKHD